MKKGDKVLISPDLTHRSQWIVGKVLEIEKTYFSGTVITAKTKTGEVYFGCADCFLEVESLKNVSYVYNII